jgi:chorismate mutase/prephenate dehydratase
MGKPGREKRLNRFAFLGEKGSCSYLAIQKYFSRRVGKLLKIGCQIFAFGKSYMVTSINV